MPRPQGFNFCDGAPLTGVERLELCYFPADGGGRSVEGPGDSDATSPCVEGNFARVRRHSQTRRLLLSLSSPHHIVAAVPPQDPHFSFPYGGTADLRGRDGQYYCFLSAPRLAINIKTEDATFRLHNLHDKGGTLVVDGSFITEAQRADPVGLQVTRRERVMTSSLRRCRCILWHASVGGRTSSASPPSGRASSSAMPEDRTQAPISP